MNTRPSSVRPVLAPTNARGGFILPALVVFSLVLMSVGMVTLQYITSSTGSIQVSHYSGVAKSAADAGIQQALTCIEAGDYTWSVDNTTLHPNTGCDGAIDSSLSEYLDKSDDGTWTSTFTVDDPVDSTDGMTLTSRGRVDFYYAGSSTPSKTFESTTKASIPTTNVNEVRPIAQGLAVTKVTAGDNFTCAIANMRVYCTGTQNHGRMGNGVSTILNPYLNPTLITTGGLASTKSVTDIKSGYYNTCAIADGESWCWGRGNMSQLGDNTTTNFKVPTKPNSVAGFSGYVQTASSGTSGSDQSQYMCLLASLKIFCTGANDYAQRGRPLVRRVCVLICSPWILQDSPWYTTLIDNAGTPVLERVFGYDVSNEPNSGLQGFADQSQLYNTRPTDVDAGAYGACTLVNARVFCWGDRFVSVTIVGDAENGNTTSSKGWRNNGAMVGKFATAMDIGESTSCLVSNGELYCWGNTVGNGTQKTLSTILPGWDTMTVSKSSNGPGAALYGVNVEGVSMMADGIYCAYGDGDGFCWGGNTSSTHTPMRVISGTTGADSITGVASGLFHACFVANGSQYCRGGATNYGQLGSGDTSTYSTSNYTRKSTTIGLTSGEAATQISAGQNHSCGVANGYIYCWGRNNRGQLGVGDTVDRTQPYGIVDVTKPKAATQVSAGYDHSCGIISGTAYCWGDNTYGQLGNNTSGNTSDEPVAVQGLGSRKVTSIDAGRYHTCAIADSQAFCWGRNNYGQIGVGASTSNQLTAQAVQGFGADVPTKITAGNEFTCAIANAYAYCWGRNNYGQIGQGSVTSASYNTAQRVPFELQNGWTSIDAGGEFVCGAVNNVAKCWGRNDQGQLGRNNINMSSANYTPADVVSSQSGQTVSWKSTVEITSGENHACAIANGDTYCWGRNADGQLGIGNTNGAPDSRLINKNAGFLDVNNAYKVSAGSNHTCVIANGKISCFGAGSFGQLGDVTNTAVRSTASTWTGNFIRQQRTIDLPNTRIF